MSTVKHRVTRRNGFTLVELLVVIGIIALLISILLPVLNKARERANGVKCMSQEKQIMYALVTYAQENKGMLPIPPAIGDTYKTYTDRRQSLMYYMSDQNSGAGVLRYDVGTFWPYLIKGVNKGYPSATSEATAAKGPLAAVFNCPSDVFEPYRRMFWGSTSIVPRNFTYSWNIQMWGTSPGGGLPGNNIGMTTVVTKLSQIKQTAHKILLIEELAPNDGECWIQCDDADDVPAQIHVDAANFGFADGHVESLTQRQLGFSTGKGFRDVKSVDYNKIRYYFSLVDPS